MVFISFNQLISQEIVEMKNTYINNKLVYKTANDSLFNGISQSKRRNRHLVYDEKFKNGIIQSSNVYFNGKKEIVSLKTIYNLNKLWVISKELYYNLEGEVTMITSYDNYGKKIFEEEFENNVLIYSCEYNGKKKHGVEYCIADCDNELRFEYINGEKIK